MIITVYVDPNQRSKIMRPISKVAPEWWDYTTLPVELIDEVARLTIADLPKLSRDGFQIRIYDTIEDFYLAEALEYVSSWKQATADSPAGICGPIGPTEQLPLVARLVNELQIDLRHAHFWGMDEWVLNGRAVPVTHPLSFERADRELCFNRIDLKLRMPDSNLHFPTAEVERYRATWRAGARCVVMQGGQGDVKHWAFNDPLRRDGPWKEAPPSAAEYRKLETRVVDLHPMTVLQNARTSGGGVVTTVPTQAVTVGPVETWMAEKVSIWHAGTHDNPFGQRLTAFMISKRIVDTSVPMSLLAEHPNVQFNYFRHGFGTCDPEMH
ncbi:MAG: glucosamine-6-phosphate isomerase [Pirellulaceae bacterium]